MRSNDPFLKIGDRKYQEVLPLYEPADPLGWLPKAIIAGAGLVFGTGCAAVLVFNSTWRNLLD